MPANTKVYDNAKACRKYRNRKREERETDKRDAAAWRRLCEAVRLRPDMDASEMLSALFGPRG